MRIRCWIIALACALCLLPQPGFSGWDPVSLSLLSSGDLAVLDSNQGVVRVTTRGARALLTGSFGGFRPIDFTALSTPEGDSFLISLRLLAGKEQAFSRMTRWSAAGKQVAEWPLRRPGLLSGVAVDPVRQIAYCIDSWLREVYQLDLRNPKASFISIARIPDAGTLGPVALDLVGRRLFVADIEKGTVLAISLDNKKVEVLLKGGTVLEPISLAFDPATQRLYIGDSAKRCVWVSTVIHGTLSVRTFATSLREPVGVALARDGKTLWVMDRGTQLLWSFGTDGRIIGKTKL